ncbi:DUF1330 domain-containing protein [Pseudomonas sp. PL-6]
MPGYWIVKGGDVRDADALKTYNDIFAAIALRYGVEIIAGKGQLETVEGRAFARQFILRFDSYATALACYRDPEYQASLELAARAYDREVSILEGQDGSAPAAQSDLERLDLERTEAAAWAELKAAVARPESGFRYLSLCSVDAENKPQARMVVLRRVDSSSRVLEFHTDMRSPKWHELRANPNATVLGFCAQTRLQFRLQGLVELHDCASEGAQTAWHSLPIRTQMLYAGGPPGDEVACVAIDEPLPSTPAGDGERNFGLLVFKVKALDWFQLRQQDSLRASFGYDEAGALVASRWMNP